MQCPCGKEIYRNQYYQETERQFEKRTRKGYCRPKCERKYAPPKLFLPKPSTSLISYRVGEGEMRVVEKEVPVRDEKYLVWIRSLRCLVPGCFGRSQAHHQNRKGHGGKGTTASDYRAVPLCYWHHRLGGTDNAPGSFHGEGKISGWGFYRHYGIDAEATIIKLNEQYNWMQKYKEKRP